MSATQIWSVAVVAGASARRLGAIGWSWLLSVVRRRCRRRWRPQRPDSLSSAPCGCGHDGRPAPGVRARCGERRRSSGSRPGVRKRGGGPNRRSRWERPGRGCKAGRWHGRVSSREPVRSARRQFGEDAQRFFRMSRCSRRRISPRAASSSAWRSAGAGAGSKRRAGFPPAPTSWQPRRRSCHCPARCGPPPACRRGRTGAAF